MKILSESKSIYVWDCFVRSFHWCVVGLFAFSYASAEELTRFHKLSGYALTILIILRLAWGVIAITTLLGNSVLAADVATAPKIEAVAEKDDATLYKEECSSCHTAYPARFLPLTSWQRLFGRLDQHFGENAELDEKTTARLLQYLAPQAADQRNAKSKARMEKQISKLGRQPDRITELPWFTRAHHELSRKMTLDNPKLGSMSLCEACHQNADQGKFDERHISIPGFGRWHD